MSAQNPFDALVKALREAGVRVHTDARPLVGFPVVLNLAAWPPVVLDLADPGLIGLFSPKGFGLAMVGANGKVRAKWGLANNVPLLHDDELLAESPVGALIESALGGVEGSEFHEGHRYYVCPYQREAVVLVADATEEALGREASRSHQLSATALKRIGRALSSKQSLQSLALPALHAIYNTYDLAAAMLWARADEHAPLTLTACVGIDRAKAKVHVLKADSKLFAALAANDRQTMLLEDVKKSPVSAGIEGVACNVPPGGAIVLPLLSASRLVGVLELVGRESDASFLANQETFETIAEHLALAIHNAVMFENVERLAAFDPLTGIANHRTMQEFIALRINEAQRKGGKVAAVMVDVDDFRRFNEEEGHDAGDRVLKTVAHCLKAHIRSHDMAARYGGEEFTLVLANADQKVAVEVAERVRLAIEALRYESKSGEARPITASFGCAVYPDVAQDAPGLLSAADQALYQAKREGRNRTRLYTGQDGPSGPPRGRRDAAA